MILMLLTLTCMHSVARRILQRSSSLPITFLVRCHKVDPIITISERTSGTKFISIIISTRRVKTLFTGSLLALPTRIQLLSSISDLVNRIFARPINARRVGMVGTPLPQLFLMVLFHQIILDLVLLDH